MDTAMKSLIAKLEAATEGSRELDVEICAKLGIRLVYVGQANMHFPPVPYTTSLDAALSLVPEGIQWDVRHIPTDEGSNWSSQVNWMPNGRLYANAPALALCIAALRARGIE